jgi:inorganic pyrophosphatase
MELELVVEIPKGSRNKYEANHESGEMWLDRMLFTATVYPADYGFFPRTLGEDDDPVDALVLLDEPTFPGCHINARPIGVFWMSDEKGPDAKVLTVPATDPRWAEVADIADLPPHMLDEIAHFFDVYKELEPDKATDVAGWKDRGEAERVIKEAQDRYESTTSTT